MSEQLEKIKQTSALIKHKFPKKFRPSAALIIEKNFEILSGFRILGEIGFDEIFSQDEILKRNAGKIIFADCGGRDVIVYSGRFHYYGGIQMRDIGFMIYVLRYLGVKKIVSVDEVGHLNPRFSCGEISLVYDHINLMGDNPLIGKNESELGLRFPDMSNAYDKSLYKKIYRIFQENMIRINESVMLGAIGPESETDAEARFYREIGADVVGYSMVPENITSVHAGLSFAGIGLITRELIADKMMEDERTDIQKIKEQKENLNKALKELGKIISRILIKI